MSKVFRERRHDAAEDRDTMQQARARRSESKNETEACERELKDKRDLQLERDVHHPPREE